MQPKMKRVSVWKEHCPVCKERLSGDNSITFPFKCSCGVWKSSIEHPFEYEIIKKQEGKDE